jgi:hypothetical protein
LHVLLIGDEDVTGLRVAVQVHAEVVMVGAADDPLPGGRPCAGVASRMWASSGITSPSR